MRVWCVLVIQDETFLCVSLLCKRKSLKKWQADNGKLTYSTKLMEIILQTHIAQICWITRSSSSSSALSFAVDESERKEKCYLNWASNKHVNHLAASSKRNLHIVGTSCRSLRIFSRTNYSFFNTCLIVKYQNVEENWNRRLKSLF